MDISKTDWGLLEQCSLNRETRPNLSVLLDVTPNYVSKEIKKLSDINLIKQVGPAKKSGMYVTTSKGEFILNKQEKYDKQHSELFREFVNSTFDLAEKLNQESDEKDIGPDDIVLTSVDAYEELFGLKETETITLQRAKDFSPYDNTYAVYGVLYSLYFHDLLDRTSGEQEFRITDRGRALLEKPTPPNVTVENINRVWNALPTKRE